MGLLIVCKGADFSKCAVDKVEIPTEPDCNHKYDNACDTNCNLCGATRVVTHNYVDGFCSVCGVRDPENLYTLAEYPVTDTLKGLYDLGGTAEASLVNRAPEPHINTADEKLDGTVGVSEDYCTFTGALNASRLLTYLRLPLVNALTAVVLFRVPAGARYLVSNRTGADNILAAGVTLQNNRVIFATNGAVTERGFTPINSTNFAILALSVNQNGLRVVRYTNGALNELVNFEGAVEAWQTGSTGNAIIIGGSGKSDIYQDADISLAAIHEGVMTDEQLGDICAFVKTYGEQKGLVIE